MKKGDDDSYRGVSHHEMVERRHGPIGTPRRDAREIRVLMRSIGIEIRMRRQKLGLTKNQLASRVGIETREIARLERTAVKIPIPIIHKTWRVLGIHQPEPKPQSRKRALTKRSPSSRTIAR